MLEIEKRRQTVGKEGERGRERLISSFRVNLGVQSYEIKNMPLT